MSTYEQDARRIGNLLEDLIPLLRADTKGKDFRPGGGGEKIVSGVCYRAPRKPPFVEQAEDLEAETHVRFKELFGSEEKRNEASRELLNMGINCAEFQASAQTWAIEFTLPRDWEPK